MDTAGEGRKERVRCVERVAWKHTLPYVKQTAHDNRCMTQGAPTAAW